MSFFAPFLSLKINKFVLQILKEKKWINGDDNNVI